MSVEILSVEDDDNLAFVIAAALTAEGYGVARVATGTDALNATLAESAFDLIVLDVMLPDVDGYEVCQRLREAGNLTPVIFLTAMDSVGDKVRGLTIGADDYVTKPFSIEELTARVRSLLRRAGRVVAPVPQRFGEVQIDLDERTVSRGGALIDLSPTEFRLLAFLSRHAGHVLSRWQIIDNVWGYGFDGDPTIVESFISQLRRKVDTSPPTLIRTVRGVGYRLERD